MSSFRRGSVLIVFALLAAACGGPSATGGPTPSGGATGQVTTAPSGATSGGATAGVRTAILSELKNQVDSKETDAMDWSTAAEGNQIEAGGGVRTGSDSHVRIATSEGSVIRIAADTTFQLAEFSLQPDDPVTKLKLDAGKVWVWVATALGAGAFDVETPSGVATVRGSLMSVEFDPQVGRLLVTCAEGRCELRDRAQNIVQLTEGEQSEIPGSGQGPLASRRMTRAQLVDWLDNFPEVRVIIQRLLDRLGDEGTPTPPPPGGGLTACDHAYFPMRPGATWSYQGDDVSFTWTVESVTGDASSASAVMTFTTGDVTGTYHWTCDANGLVSYDFGSLDTSQFGTIAEYTVNSSSGSWLPAADLLKVGYSWSNAYETHMKMTIPGGAGEGEGTIGVSSSSTVIGTDPVTVGDQTFDGLQLSQESTHEISFTLQGVSVPATASRTSSRYVLARGVGIVSSQTSGEGFSSSSTLVSYSVP